MAITPVRTLLVESYQRQSEELTRVKAVHNRLRFIIVVGAVGAVVGSIAGAIWKGPKGIGPGIVYGSAAAIFVCHHIRKWLA